MNIKLEVCGCYYDVLAKSMRNYCLTSVNCQGLESGSYGQINIVLSSGLLETFCVPSFNPPKMTAQNIPRAQYAKMQAKRGSVALRGKHVNIRT